MHVCKIVLGWSVYRYVVVSRYCIDTCKLARFGTSFKPIVLFYSFFAAAQSIPACSPSPAIQLHAFNSSCGASDRYTQYAVCLRFPFSLGRAFSAIYACATICKFWLETISDSVGSGSPKKFARPGLVRMWKGYVYIYIYNSYYNGARPNFCSH